MKKKNKKAARDPNIWNSVSQRESESHAPSLVHNLAQN